MKCGAVRFVLLLAPGLALAQFPPQIKNVVVVFQENRTPDNLFHLLTPACPIPAGASGLDACTPSPVTTSCYDISPCGLSNQSGKVVPVRLKGVPLSGSVDPRHTHDAFVTMCDPAPGTFRCRNDGAWRISDPLGASYAYVASPEVVNSDGSKGRLLDPYLTLAKQYGWANNMFQTNQGPSYPAHQFMFSGTSAPTAADDAKATFVAENFTSGGLLINAGCLAPNDMDNALISPALSAPPAGCKLYADGSIQECPFNNTALVYPTNPIGSFCFSHPTMADVLEPHAIAWKYYTSSSGSIWTAPDSIRSICQPAWVDPINDPGAGLQCTGTEWNAHVDVENLGTDILRDIASCNLANVSWVIPDGKWADHPDPDAHYGPSWVATVVNAIGNNPTCPQGTPDAGQNYWQNTAIVITWDDWGGWSDHRPPPAPTQLPCVSAGCQDDYQLGFRVPLIVVSAYTPAGTINNDVHDFGSVLRMIEGINHLPEGQLGFADKRARNDLRSFFGLTQARSYQTVPAEKDANYFLSQFGPALDPDDY